MVRYCFVLILLLIVGCGRLNEQPNDGPAELNSTTVPSDQTAPTVVSVSPSFNQNNLSGFSSFSVTFSEPIDSSSVSFKNSDRGCDQAVRVQWVNSSLCETIDSVSTDDDTTFTFALSESLGSSLSYTLTVTEQVKDQAGNALGSVYGGTWKIASSASQ